MDVCLFFFKRQSIIADLIGLSPKQAVLEPAVLEEFQEALLQLHLFPLPGLCPNLQVANLLQSILPVPRLLPRSDYSSVW